jgi:hypothetical protein
MEKKRSLPLYLQLIPLMLVPLEYNEMPVRFGDTAVVNAGFHCKSSDTKADNACAPDSVKSWWTAPHYVAAYTGVHRRTVFTL